MPAPVYTRIPEVPYPHGHLVTEFFNLFTMNTKFVKESGISLWL